MTPPFRDPGDGSPPRASVIVPHYNTPELLVRALQSLAGQRLSEGWFELIVVDNGSRLPLAPLAAAWPDARFLLCHERGPGPARNLGVAEARGAVLGFVDADVTVAPEWFEAGMAAVAQSGSGHVGGDIQIALRDPPAMTDVEAFERVFSFRQRDYIEKKGYSVTANLMVTRAVFAVAGPFGGIDTQEDWDFGRRACAAGFPPRYAPAMRAFHPARASIADMRSKWFRLSVQALATHLAEGRSLVQWQMRAILVMLSAVAHAPRMLFSRRVEGLANRMKGLRVLLAIRYGRGLDMLRIARTMARGDRVSAEGWNA
jgi:glycosyltransferase involved in cell wall biosynthesis